MFRAISARRQVDSFEWKISSGGKVVHQQRSRGFNERYSQRFYSLMSPSIGYTFLNIRNSINFENDFEIKIVAIFKDKTQSSCTVSNVWFSG